jgi:hypothetical protein
VVLPHVGRAISAVAIALVAVGPVSELKKIPKQAASS